ncbi:hypothetical protein B9S64_07150 [Streptomyces sp. SM18]|nr:hypothetical protein B9S64_07150 [Streptomyces sp. SM18]
MGCRCAGPVPLPAPSRNRGSAPDPAPQAPEGLEWAACRSGPRSSSAGGAGMGVPEGLEWAACVSGRGGLRVWGRGAPYMPEARPGPLVRAGLRGGQAWVLRRRNVRFRPSSSKGAPYVESASPWA